MKTRWVDPGFHKDQEKLNERHDCTVVALAIAAGIPYKRAHAVLKRAGRKDRDGFDLAGWLDETDNCTSFLPPRKKRAKLWKVALAVPRGRWIAHTKNHALAIVNGAMYDSVPPLFSKVHVIQKLDKNLTL